MSVFNHQRYPIHAMTVTVNLKYYTYHNVNTSHLYPCSCVAKDIKIIKLHFTDPFLHCQGHQESQIPFHLIPLYHAVGTIKASKISHYWYTNIYTRNHAKALCQIQYKILLSQTLRYSYAWNTKISIIKKNRVVFL